MLWRKGHYGGRSETAARNDAHLFLKGYPSRKHALNQKQRRRPGANDKGLGFPSPLQQRVVK